MSLWQQLRAIFREMPSFYADRFDNWVSDVHHPYDNDPTLPCSGCRKPWPCKDYMDATDRAYGRRQRRSGGQP